MPHDLKAGPTPLFFTESPPFSIDAPGYERVEGETLPRRNPKAKDGLITRPAPDVYTVFDLVKRSTQKNAGEPAIGSRKLIKTHKEKKKVPKTVDGKVTQVDKEWTFFELSPYTFQTFGEYFVTISQLGAGLRKLGLSPGDKLHIFATTGWVIPQLGLSSLDP